MTDRRNDRLIEVAKETVHIVETGAYDAPSGKRVSIKDHVVAAVTGTRTFRPHDLDALVARTPKPGPCNDVTVTGETTAQASRRLVANEGAPRVCALNFASARKAGGGFLNGARAQEEDLARCSALHACLLGQREYYDSNRAQESALYTDHLIHSPAVPFFRDEDLQLLEEPFLVAVLTAPAPNATVVRANERNVINRIAPVLRVRARKLVALAVERGDKTLVLGAWGCGVFGNDPDEVADAFGEVLDDYGGAFERIVFAVWERTPGASPNRRAFEARFQR